MQGTRGTDGCLNCGETREIAAHGLCFKCYRRKERADDRQFAGVDLHNPGVRREHKKLFRGFTAVMTGLSDLAVQKSDVLAIRRMLDPYVASIAEFLSPVAEQDEPKADVNGEQTSRQMFTVHTAQAEVTQATVTGKI
jgi:hypothetical protein